MGRYQYGAAETVAPARLSRRHARPPCGLRQTWRLSYDFSSRFVKSDIRLYIPARIEGPIRTIVYVSGVDRGLTSRTQGYATVS